MIAAFDQLPPQLPRSVTWDQGIEWRRAGEILVERPTVVAVDVLPDDLDGELSFPIGDLPIGERDLGDDFMDATDELVCEVGVGRVVQDRQVVSGTGGLTFDVRTEHLQRDQRDEEG